MKNILLILLFISIQSFAQRTIVSLNGIWEVEESIKPDVFPKKYTHTAAVPGLTDQSKPKFTDIDKFTTIDVLKHPIIGIKNDPSLDSIKIGIIGQKRNFFWYRHNFELKEQKEVVVLKIGKAQFGTQVWINGKNAGIHYGCFTAGYFNITGLVKQSGKNEIILRIGAHPRALPEWVPFGTDAEKRKWTPGILDDVSVIACNNPFIETLQIAPDINNLQIKVQTKVINYKEDGKFNVNYTVSEWKGNTIKAQKTRTIDLKKNEELTVDEVLDLPNPHLWSPNDPFLYVMDASTHKVSIAVGFNQQGDNLTSRFGMREFHYDSKTQRAYLNNKIIFLRGSNIVINEFYEDSLCKGNPWNEKWVRKLIYDIPKSLYWNSFRFCLGPPPDKWYEIADEAGLLIQDEFFLWWEKNYWNYSELETQVKEWMQDRWNHPSVVIWDLQNETRSDRLGDMINRLRPLDLSNRQWENGWSKPAGENDPVEDHNYLNYTDPQWGRISPWRMPVYMKGTGGRSLNSFNPTTHAAVLNEYGWMWIQRNGKPTLLSENFYNTIAPGITDQQRIELYGYLLAGETEYFRAFRNYAGINHFTYLTPDYPTSFTGDLFQDITNLKLHPVLENYVREAFKPLGVYLHFWMGEIKVNAKKPGRFPIVLINDEYSKLKGILELRIETTDGKLVKKTEKPFEISELIADTYLIDCEYPTEPGEYVVKAIAHPENYEPKTTTSIRKLKMLP